MVGMGAMEFAEQDGFRHFPKPQHEGNDDGINTGLSLFDLHRWRRSFPRGKYTQFVKEAYNKYGEHFVFPTQVPRVPVPGPSGLASSVGTPALLRHAMRCACLDLLSLVGLCLAVPLINTTYLPQHYSTAAGFLQRLAWRPS